MKQRHIPIGIKSTLLTIFLISLVTAGIQALVYFNKPAIFENWSYPVIFAVGAIVAACLTGLTLLFLSRHLVDRPLQDMISEIQHAEEKDYLIRIPFRSKNVIGELTTAFNTLMERITTLNAFKMETERELISAQQEIKYKGELEKKNRQLTLLHDIARALSQTMDPEDLYQWVLTIVGCMLDYNELVLMLYNVSTKKLKVTATYGISNPEEIIGMEFAVGEGVTGAAIQQKKPIYIPNTKRDNRYLYYKGQKPEDVSLLTVPLIGPSGDNVIGALNVSRPADESFQKQERETLQAVSHLISVAITNAHLYRRLKELSVRDDMTGLYNRRFGQETVRREITRANRFNRTLSILMIDIDRFKKFNDNYGHPKGDVVLQEFAELLLGSLRDVDYVTRWGGEEFLIILPSTDISGALNVAEKIRLTIKRHNFSRLDIQSKVHFTVSIGVANFPDNAEDDDNLVLYADEALYEAKRKGRDRVVVAKPVEASKKVV